MIDTSALIWFILTILMMAFFAGIEMAYYSVNRFGIELKKKQGKRAAQILSRLMKTPEIFVGTTIIGFTVSLVCFVLVFNYITDPLWDWIPIRSDSIRLALDIILGTFIVLVFGEFIPRAIFRAHSNIILTRLVGIVNLFHHLLQPVAAMFVTVSNWLLKYLFNIRMDATKEAFSKSDIEP